MLSVKMLLFKIYVIFIDVMFIDFYMKKMLSSYAIFRSETILWREDSICLEQKFVLK